MRTRGIVNYDSFGGTECPQNRHWEIVCEPSTCPINCNVSKWEQWSTCDISCGYGSQQRSRSIITTPNYLDYVCPPLNETKVCHTQACPVDCSVGKWVPWQCSASCGPGTEWREREILVQAQNGGTACTTQLNMSRSCNLMSCPIDCNLSAWTEFSNCSRTCGSGVSYRNRTVITQPEHGGKECSPKFETRQCDLGHCPVNCSVSKWGAFGNCSASCGGGLKGRMRTIITHPQNTNFTCPALSENVHCATTNCPVDCAVGVWSRWESFAGGGARIRRTRPKLIATRFGGKSCPTLLEEKESWAMIHTCNEQIHCDGSWSECTKSCNSGVQYRHCNHTICAKHAVVELAFSFRQSRQCNTMTCP